SNENHQVTRRVHFRPAAKESAEDWNIAEHGNGFDQGGSCPLKHASHDHGFAGFYNHARGKFLSAILGQTDRETVECVIGSSLEVGERGVGHELDIGINA